MGSGNETEESLMSIVYVLECSNRFKIGLTKNSLNKRLRTLQTGSAHELKPRLEISTNRPNLLEKHFHFLFASKRRGGEWFDLSPEDLYLLGLTQGVYKGFCDFDSSGKVVSCSSFLQQLLKGLF